MMTTQLSVIGMKAQTSPAGCGQVPKPRSGAPKAQDLSAERGRRTMINAVVGTTHASLAQHTKFLTDPIQVSHQLAYSRRPASLPCLEFRHGSERFLIRHLNVERHGLLLRYADQQHANRIRHR